MARKLQTSDVFAGIRAINAIGIKEDIKKMCMKANSVQEIVQEEVGFEMIWGIFEKMIGTKGESEIYKFAANIFECSPEDLAKMDPVELLNGLLEAAEPEKWKSFFASVARLMRLN